MDIITYALAKNSADDAVAAAISALPKGIIYKGAVSYESDLPNTAEVGDCYTIKYSGSSGSNPDGREVVWGNYEGTAQWITLGASLPSVDASDNGKVLSVKDGAWAADSNLFVAEFSGSPLTCNKTYQEIVDAVNAGRAVIGVRGNDVYVYSGKDISNVNFTRILGKSLTIARIALSSSNTAQAAGASLAPTTTSTDNGCELIVKSGAWAKQQKKFVVTLTPTAQDFSGTMDKTVSEITAAYEAGQEIVFKLQTAASSYIEVPVQLVGHNTTFTYPSFETSVVQCANNIQVFAYTGVTNDGTKQTYSTTVYSLTPAS